MRVGVVMTRRRDVGVGRLVELITRHAAELLVAGDTSGARHALSVLRRHIRPGSGLARELAVFRTLKDARLTSEGAARAVIREARTILGDLDADRDRTDRERFAADACHLLGYDVATGTPVLVEQETADAQGLIEGWRSGFANPLSAALLEERVVGRMLAPVAGGTTTDDVGGAGTPIDGLVVRLMTEKFNSKYANMTSAQRKIVSEYLHSPNGRSDDLVDILTDLRSEAVTLMEGAVAEASSEYLREKLTRARDIVAAADVLRPDERSVAMFMGVAQLVEELKCQ